MCEFLALNFITFSEFKCNRLLLDTKWKWFCVKHVHKNETDMRDENERAIESVSERVIE